MLFFISRFLPADAAQNESKPTDEKKEKDDDSSSSSSSDDEKKKDEEGEKLKERSKVLR